jgi:RNA polymerase sigma-70 factor (ECF subfamily)
VASQGSKLSVVNAVAIMPTVTDDAPGGEVVDPDRELVERHRAGERGAFDDLVRRHQRALWRVARRYVKNDADAADVVQQAFVRAFRAVDGFRGAASVRSWLFRITINTALNHVRDHGRDRADELADDALTAGPEGTLRLEAAQASDQLRAAVATLPDKQRTVLELRVFDDLSFREVAELADCTENAAKVNFHYAVKRLRQLLVGTDG